MKKILISLCFFVQVIIAQENVEQIENNLEVLRLEQKYNIILYENLKGTIPFYTLNAVLDPFASPFENDLLNENKKSINELNIAKMERIKSNMRETFSIYRKGQNKYDLGVFSDILGYASTAAAAGLAAYHLYKYKDKYRIK